MIGYLLKILAVVLMSFFVIYFYYNMPNVQHSFDFNGYIGIFIPLAIFYAIYKFIQLEINDRQASFSPLGLIGIFIGILFCISLFYFGIKGQAYSGGFILFFKILYFSFLPLIIGFLSYTFGKTLLGLTQVFKNYSDGVRFVAAFAGGFMIFVSLLDVIGFVGFYNSWSVGVLLLIMFIISYKTCGQSLLQMGQAKITIDIEEGNYLKLLSAEFLFTLASIIGAIALVSIVRPFPIGWDDLGVYMNNPKLLAGAGEITTLGAMYAWQTFTGIGYMFGSATQAFFLNIFGGFASFIVLLLIFSDVLKSQKKFFIHIPLLLAVLFISLPMIFFELAKDMKIDPGLFFISISCVYITFSFLKEKVISKNNLLICLLIGMLLGFAFALKFTTLLLIIAIFGVFFFQRLGSFGLIGFLGIFIAIFTYGGLWELMKVLLPTDNPELIQSITITALLIGIIAFVLAIKNKIGIFKNTILEILVVIFGICLTLSPWLIKHSVDIYPNITMSGLLSGEREYYKIDYTKIYSQEVLDDIKIKKIAERKTDNGTTANEDLGRYFGYDEGIINYIKLPWNLTMQVNQKGEFTDIGFLFLALLPAILLFLPFRNKYYSPSIIGLLLLFEIFIFVGLFDSIFSTISLPFGYIVLLGMTLIPLAILGYGLDYKTENKETQEHLDILKLLLVFTGIYVFLWMIAAYGIVWYGITMYFSFLLFIGYGLMYVSGYKDSDSEQVYYSRLFGSLIMFLICLIYIVQSVIPAAFNNLKNEGLIEYKRGDFNQTESLFRYHSNYLPLLYAMNIDPEKREEFLKEVLPKEIIDVISDIKNTPIIPLVQYIYGLQKSESGHISIYKEVLDTLYSGIITPDDRFKNTKIIYRAGTFMKYHISENNKRLFEDGLLFNFNDYVHNSDTKITIDNFRKLGVSYMLFDLNAATIDQSELHNLTQRYEKLLSTIVSKELELIETDSICLKTALEIYKKDSDIKNFMDIGGVNYDSYDSNNIKIPRRDKAIICYQKMVDLIQTDQVNTENYSYLLALKQYMETLETTDANTLFQYIHSTYGRSSLALFEIK